MNVRDLTQELGMNVSTNVLQPAGGDLLVLKIDGFLKSEQRERLRETLVPKFTSLGCQVVVLEGGMDVMLIKQAADSEPAAPDE
jgi:hypothetical protein